MFSADNSNKRGLILMTALLPTVGHQYLIDFASGFLTYEDNLDIMICTRSFEPIDGELRYQAFKDIDRKLGQPRLMFYHLADDSVPQNPSDTEHFWKIWHFLVSETTGENKYDYVFASEPYGKTLADIFNAEYIPCDIAREVFPVKSSEVRKDIIQNFGLIMPSMQRLIRQKVVLFGAESTGKTTMAKLLSERLNGYFAPEWARGYLEEIGPKLTNTKMSNITNGQISLEGVMDWKNDKPFVFHDTNILSTLGYYRLNPQFIPEIDLDEYCRDDDVDLYIVMNDQIPFETDPLRYGGDKRESDTTFWIKLLEEFKCKYYVVQSTGSVEEQYAEIEPLMKDLYAFELIKGFERE